MRIKLSDHFTYKKLIMFVIPSVAMMIFTSIYSVVDGLFVSNYVGKTPFAALNLIMPALMILGSFGFMIGTGGNAVVSAMLGAGHDKQAKECFTMFAFMSFVIGVAISVIGFIFMRPAALLLGADEAMLPYCVLYGRIIIAATPLFMLQTMFHGFFVTAEKPQLGFFVTVGAGCTNILLDFLLVAVFKWGLAGAALATALAQLVGGAVPVIYFARENNSLLRFTKLKINTNIFFKACGNGISEFMTNVSMSVVSMIYNYQLIRFSGENGIAAYGVIMYTNFIFSAIFIGYSIGASPITGYNYGGGNSTELKNILKKSLIIISVSGITMTLTAFALAYPITKIFVGYDAELFALTRRGFILCAVSFLIAGFNIFGSAFFTALGNGVISAVISFLRTFIFQTAAVFILPVFLKTDGIWLSITAAELAAVIITAVFIVTNNKRYKYM